MIETQTPQKERMGKEKFGGGSKKQVTVGGGDYGGIIAGKFGDFLISRRIKGIV